MKPVYLTTPLYYVNAEPHLGHTYTMVLVDAWARWARQRGCETFFMTGTDEHGAKIAEAASAAGVSPRDWVDRVAAKFRAAWDELGITYDHFIRTTDPSHVAYVQDVLTRIHERGQIYFAEYGGLYCTGCERFYPEKELADGLCPDHGTKPEWVEEGNYFFRMSAYQGALEDHLRDHPDTIRPERYRNEVLSFLREPLGDLCISRPKTRLSWGVELPFDDRYVTYVWFDALLNYVSGPASRGPEFFERMWPEAQHFIGKDILKTHGIYWPTMLLAAGLPIYRHLNVHGFWTVEGRKMSKSLANAVSPGEMAAKYGRDAFRYFLMRESVFGLDATFREDALAARYQGDLGNNLGNLVSRGLAMLNKYCDGELRGVEPGEPLDAELRAAFDDAAHEIDAAMDVLAFHRAVESLLRATDRANKYVSDTAPFRLAKSPESLPRVGAILHNVAEAILRSAHLAAPFLPDTAARIHEMLGTDPDATFGFAWREGFAPGHRVGTAEPLFPRLPEPA